MDGLQVVSVPTYDWFFHKCINFELSEAPQHWELLLKRTGKEKEFKLYTDDILIEYWVDFCQYVGDVISRHYSR